jgi:hypothetical protein
MRAIGRGSLSSILKIVVDVAWVIACALLGFIWIIAAISMLRLSFGEDFLPGLERIVVSNPRELIAWTLQGTILCVGGMIVCAYLRGVFSTLVAGDPFVPDNARRLRAIAFTVAIMEVLRLAVSLLSHLLLNLFGVTQPEGMTMAISANLSVWFSVLTLIVLAQVFHEGAALREEQKMTI